MNIKNLIILSVSSVILFALCSSLAILGLTTKLFLGSTLYFFSVYLLRRYFSASKVLVAFTILFPVFLSIVFVNIIYFQESKFSLPSHIFFILGGIAGILYFYKKQVIGIVVVILLLLFWQFSLEKKYSNYMTYGTASGEVNLSIPESQLYDSHNKLQIIPTDKTIILDFWNSHCTVCFKYFPLLDSLNTHNSVEVILINIPLNGEEKEDNFKILDPFHYGFKQLFAEDTLVVTKFQVQYYPTTFIIKKGKIIFKGLITDGMKYL